jgi:hypothetical protein
MTQKSFSATYAHGRHVEFIPTKALFARQIGLSSFAMRFYNLDAMPSSLKVQLAFNTHMNVFLSLEILLEGSFTLAF